MSQLFPPLLLIEEKCHMVEIKRDTDASFGEAKWEETGMEVSNPPAPINAPPPHLGGDIAASLLIDL